MVSIDHYLYTKRKYNHSLGGMGKKGLKKKKHLPVSCTGNCFRLNRIHYLAEPLKRYDIRYKQKQTFSELTGFGEDRKFEKTSSFDQRCLAQALESLNHWHTKLVWSFLRHKECHDVLDIQGIALATNLSPFWTEWSTSTYSLQNKYAFIFINKILLTKLSDSIT